MSSAAHQQIPGALAIIAALPRELTPLSRRLGAIRISSANGILVQTANLPGSLSPILLVAAGMGPQRAAMAVAAALAHGPVHTLLSVGLAGACDPALAPAALVEPNVVLDTNSGERFDTTAPAAPLHPVILVTTQHIASPAEKQRLRASYNAAAVDMEAATVARLARAHGIPFAALKAISDEHTVDLSHLSPFTNARGHFRTAPFAIHTAIRPHRWRNTLALGRSSKAALSAMTAAIYQLIGNRTS